MSAKVFKKPWFLSVLLIAVMPWVQAEDPMEEIVVTGSFIRGAPEDAALPVDVIARTDIDDIGRPTIVELVRRLPYTSGNFGEADPFLGRPGDIATFNMRGLGFNRSLVLVNGYRSLTEINSMPRIAIGRIEVLKEGASTIYGSDAIGGVINFITRNEFDGLELAASFQDVDGSSGEYNISALYGLQRDKVRLLVALEYDRRNVLKIREKDWALLPLSENPQGGWSSIGNPGAFVPAVGPSRSMIIGGLTPQTLMQSCSAA